MFKHILCPVDFSEASAHAIRYAVALARSQHAALTALHALPATPANPPLPDVDAGTAAVDEAKQVATEVAALFADATRRGIRVDVVVDRGAAAREVLTHAADLAVDVIVMGTHGVAGFEHMVLGSVAEKVLRKATCPVLTVPPHAQFNPEMPFKTLVCAIDFSEWSIAALDEACAIAEESRGSVTAVHVIEWPWANGAAVEADALPPAQATALAEFRRYQETMARSRFETTVRDTCRDRCRIDARIVHGKSYSEILCAAERQRADLIVMGVHGRNPLDVFFFGSTTHQVVRRAPCPVLTLRH
jgi:nucleotide-binding universal stress UspA family protein